MCFLFTTNNIVSVLKLTLRVPHSFLIESAHHKMWIWAHCVKKKNFYPLPDYKNTTNGAYFALPRLIIRPVWKTFSCLGLGTLSPFEIIVPALILAQSTASTNAPRPSHSLIPFNILAI